MIFNIIKKEIKELLNRSTIISLIFVSFVLGYIGRYVSNAEKNAEINDANIVIIDKDSTEISKKFSDLILKYSKGEFEKKNFKDQLETLKKEGGAIISIEKGFQDAILKGEKGELKVEWILKGTGLFDFMSSDMIEKCLTYSKNDLSKYLLIEEGIKKENVLDPFMVKAQDLKVKEKTFKNVNPKTLYSFLGNQTNFVPVIIMMLLVMSGGMIISSMGMEKENKTLETLLTMPVERRDIVLGKIIGGGIVGMVMASIYMTGFYNYVKGFSENVSYMPDLKVFYFSDYILIGVSIFLSLLSGLSMCLLLGLFAKDYKSAQTLTMPVSILAIIPMFLTMFKDFNTLSLPFRTIVFLIPFSHPMMAMKLLFFDQYNMVFYGILYNFLFFTILVIILVYIFNTDYIITGKGFERFFKSKNPKRFGVF
ncbi:MAG: ABC transporter permease [candidate division WOR-3 bacterium]